MKSEQEFKQDLEARADEEAMEGAACWLALYAVLKLFNLKSFIIAAQLYMKIRDQSF